MPRYFLHIVNQVGFVEDEEGLDLESFDQARGKAIDGIRSLLAGELATGQIDLHGHIEIADDGGERLAIVRFAEAVEIRNEPGA